MYIVAEHTIKDPESFFRLAPRILQAPHGLKLVQSLPNMSNNRANCLWEADSVDTLRAFLDPLTAHSSHNAYYEVDTKKATGMPSVFVVAEHTIKNPEAFFKLMPRVLDAPQGLKVTRSLPNVGGNRSVCLWEAPSVEALKAFLDPLIGDNSHNSYYEVDTTKATSLPELATAAAA